VIVQVFVAQRNAADTLGQHGLHVVDDLLRIARIDNATRQCRGQPDSPIDFAKQQPASIGRQPPAVEISGDFTSE